MAGLCDRPGVQLKRTDVCSVSLQVIVDILKSCTETAKPEPLEGLKRRYSVRPSNVNAGIAIIEL